MVQLEIQLSTVLDTYIDVLNLLATSNEILELLPNTINNSRITTLSKEIQELAEKLHEDVCQIMDEGSDNLEEGFEFMSEKYKLLHGKELEEYQAKFEI